MVSVLFVLKKNGILRLYIDYKILNKVTIKNRYFLFLILKILKRFGSAKIFLKLNLQKVYYYIHIKKNDK